MFCTVMTYKLLRHTVTRPYAGFRHPDRMAPDQTVRGGENDCFIWSGNFLAQVPEFSSIFRNPGIFLRFTWPSVRRVPFRKTFPEFSGDLPCEKTKECTWWDRTQDLRNTTPLLYLYTTTTLHASSQNIAYCFSFIQLHVLIVSEFAIKNKQ